MIVVTKEGKLITLDFTQKTKVTELKESQAKMADIGLGSSAVVEYAVKGREKRPEQNRVHPGEGR